MAGLVPAIHVLLFGCCRKDVDARHKAGHDGNNYPSIWVSPQIEIAWPEIVLPRGLHMNRI